MKEPCERCRSKAVMPVGVCLNCGFHNDPEPGYENQSQVERNSPALNGEETQLDHSNEASKPVTEK